ncbi:hypothetical protein [Streptomyces goshikiensis]|uniref:hypothetical protein n=1 Tax=Streptomyces goshikiensis TaxID=1942 RepID=UPI0036881343
MTDTTTSTTDQLRTEAEVLPLLALYEACSYCKGEWLKQNPAYAEHADKGWVLLAAAIQARLAAGLSNGDEDPKIVDTRAPYRGRIVVDPLHDKFGPDADKARVATLAWRMHQGNPPKWPDGHPQEEEFYCIECDGHSGYQPTAAGRQVLDFLRIFQR